MQYDTANIIYLIGLVLVNYIIYFKWTDHRIRVRVRSCYKSSVAANGNRAVCNVCVWLSKRQKSDVNVGRAELSCQSGSKCTEYSAACQLINAAASQDKEKSCLLFPQLLEK